MMAHKLKEKLYHVSLSLGWDVEAKSVKGAKEEIRQATGFKFNPKNLKIERPDWDKE